MENQGTFRINEEARRYELEVENTMAYAEFIKAQENVIYITHTEVPASLEGKGVGSALIRQALDHIRVSGQKLVPLCPFTAAFVKRHPEYQDLLREGFHV